MDNLTFHDANLHGEIVLSTTMGAWNSWQMFSFLSLLFPYLFLFLSPFKIVHFQLVKIQNFAQGRTLNS